MVDFGADYTYTSRASLLLLLFIFLKIEFRLRYQFFFVDEETGMVLSKSVLPLTGFKREVVEQNTPH